MIKDSQNDFEKLSKLMTKSSQVFTEKYWKNKKFLQSPDCDEVLKDKFLGLLGDSKKSLEKLERNFVDLLKNLECCSDGSKTEDDRPDDGSRGEGVPAAMEVDGAAEATEAKTVAEEARDEKAVVGDAEVKDEVDESADGERSRRSGESATVLDVDGDGDGAIPGKEVSSLDTTVNADELGESGDDGATPDTEVNSRDTTVNPSELGEPGIGSATSCLDRTSLIVNVDESELDKSASEDEETKTKSVTGGEGDLVEDLSTRETECDENSSSSSSEETKDKRESRSSSRETQATKEPKDSRKSSSSGREMKDARKSSSSAKERKELENSSPTKETENVENLSSPTKKAKDVYKSTSTTKEETKDVENSSSATEERKDVENSLSPIKSKDVEDLSSPTKDTKDSENALSPRNAPTKDKKGGDDGKSPSEEPKTNGSAAELASKKEKLAKDALLNSSDNTSSENESKIKSSESGMSGIDSLKSDDDAKLV